MLSIIERLDEISYGRNLIHSFSSTLINEIVRKNFCAVDDDHQCILK
jgi:hypothetical protein